jgi:branched-chain amino acid aminotransferase
MFRPDCNMERMNTSMERLALPNFDGDGLVECMKELLKIDKDWIPQGEGYSLYIRPTGISTHPCVGVARAASAKIYVILSPVGPYYPEGFAPVKLLAGDEYVRAWPGGTGDTKIGGNYGPTILPQSEAAAKGFQQLMWLFADGDEHLVTEVGTMNVMVSAMSAMSVQR